MEFLGLTGGQLLLLVGLALALVFVLFVLVAALKLTKRLFKLGCLGVIVVLAGVFFLMRAVG